MLCDVFILVFGIVGFYKLVSIFPEFSTQNNITKRFQLQCNKNIYIDEQFLGAHLLTMQPSMHTLFVEYAKLAHFFALLCHI